MKFLRNPTLSAVNNAFFLVAVTFTAVRLVGALVKVSKPVPAGGST